MTLAGSRTCDVAWWPMDNASGTAGGSCQSPSQSRRLYRCQALCGGARSNVPAIHTRGGNGEANRVRSEDHAVHDWYRFVLSFPSRIRSARCRPPGDQAHCRRGQEAARRARQGVRLRAALRQGHDAVLRRDGSPPGRPMRDPAPRRLTGLRRRLTAVEVRVGCESL